MNKYTFSAQSGKVYYCNSIPWFMGDNSTYEFFSLLDQGITVEFKTI